MLSEPRHHSENLPERLFGHESRRIAAAAASGSPATAPWCSTKSASAPRSAASCCTFRGVPLPPVGGTRDIAADVGHRADQPRLVAMVRRRAPQRPLPLNVFRQNAVAPAQRDIRPGAPLLATPPAGRRFGSLTAKRKTRCRLCPARQRARAAHVERDGVERGLKIAPPLVLTGWRSK
jgi:hypothetical protein